MKTILIVDDLPINRDFVKVELKDRFHLIEAENGEDAVVILKTNEVDLIITDIFMDHMNGYEFMRTVRKNPNTKHIPIIAITENIESSQSKAIAAGADIYIDRPAREEMLVKSILQLTGQDHGRKDLFNLDFVLDSIPGAVIVSKFRTEVPEILYCSRGVHYVAGVEAGEFGNMIKQMGESILYPPDQKKFIDCMKRIIRTKSRGEMIFRAYKGKDNFVWLWLQARYIGEEDGDPVVEQIILDVSNSTNMYESLLDEASSMITVIDWETYEILYANRKAREVLSEGTDKKCYQLFFGRMEPCEKCAAYNNKCEMQEKVWVHAGRSYRQILKRIKWNGRAAILKCMEDVTEQIELQEYVEEEKDTLNRIIQNVPAGLFVFKMEEQGKIKIVEANPSASALMGIDFEKTIGAGVKEVFELTHPDDREKIREIIERCGTPGTVIPYEYRQYNRVKKEYRWLSARAHSVLEKDGSIYIYISYFDISEQKKSQKLREDLRIAQLESQAKTEFMSNMSHDMRTPLNGILGLANLMTEKTNLQEMQEDARQLMVSGQLLLNLINDTLDISKIESGKLELHKKPMNSFMIFHNIITTVELTANQAGVQLVYDLPQLPKEQWIPVISDASRIQQILINIITNAIKYSREGGVVELHMELLSVTESQVTDKYTVVDHGIGMSEEFLPHIFDPFVQEHRVQTANGQGSGLGMSIVKQLVDLMGGEITVESKLDEGTTVTVIMHYYIFKGDLAVEEKGKMGFQLEGMHVLICEDHPLNQKIVEQLLKKQGMIVDIAENGKIGVDCFEKSKPGEYQAILMDVRMPVMDGVTAAKTIRSMDRGDARNIPIIAMTANAFEEDKEETRAAGMNEHLAKPVEPKTLFEVLSKYRKTT